MNVLLCIILSFVLNQSGIVNLISLTIGVVGIILSIYFYIKSRKNRAPVYRSRTTRLIKDSLNQINNLEVYYENKKLSALSITKVAFWNSGRETISYDDISKNDKLRLVIDDKYVFLSCDVIVQTKDANGFVAVLSEDRRTIYLNFDYLDYEEGVVLRIRHTGSSDTDIMLKGSIKAVSEIRRKDRVWRTSKKPKTINPRVVFFLKYLAGFLSILIMVVGVIYLFSSDDSWRRSLHSPFGDTIDRITSSIFFIVIGLAYSILFYDSIKKPVPKSLMEKYMDEDF